MKEYKHLVHMNQLFPNHDFQTLVESMGYGLNEVVILDIETTGFHRTYDVISVLGLIYFETSPDQSNGYVIQLFNESGKEDASILSQLQYYLKNCNLLITFNGDRFDIPFLLEKHRMHGTVSQPLFSNPFMTSLDLYKVSKLQFPHLKKCTLKAVEEQLQIHRDDLISGKEAAESYKNYLKTKAFELCRPMLQHNYEDILNLVPLFSALYCTATETNSPSAICFPLRAINGRITQIHYKSSQLSILGEYFTPPHPNGITNTPSAPSQQHPTPPHQHPAHLLIDPIFEDQIHHCDHTIDFNAHQLKIQFKCIHASPYHLVDFFNGVIPLTTLTNEQLSALIISTDDELDSNKIKQFSKDAFYYVLKYYL